MALPVPKAEPIPEEGPYVFRSARGEDGDVRILQLPATLEILLDPRLEDQVTQSNRHLNTLIPLFDALKRYLERLAPNLAVFSDLLLLYKRHGYRDVTPDVAVVDGLADRDAVDQSLDVTAEGARLRLVMEVVSTDARDMRRKDEEVNPGLFADLGVEDYVLVYPPEGETPTRIMAYRLSSFGSYAANSPDHRGRVFLESVGVWLWADEESGRLALEHGESGERLLTSEEEETERREAQRHAAETILKILDSRGLSLSDADRRRVLDGRDMEELRRWTDRAFSVEGVEELWR
jgi:Uma2 family endonuclease